MNAFSRAFRLLAVVVALACLAATAGGQILFTQKGNASFYADRFHGRRMANGQLYHRDSMTCAHLRYPLGTRLVVRNLTNGKQVVVTVTDRGPYTRKFVIDLSRAAARKLDIIRYGYQLVEITPYVAWRVPLKYDPEIERPELDLGYSADVDLGPPVWQDDSIFWSRHRRERTEVVQEFRDSLLTTLHEDTTLRHAAIKTTQQTPPASGAANGRSRRRR